jgi:hypothetical protein
MAKLLLMSILIATVAIPMQLADAPNAKNALRSVIIRFSIYAVLWVAFCVLLYQAMV